MNYVSSAGMAPKRIPYLVEEPDLMFKTVTRGTSQRGITGLETAIILIAFTVVASVFAFTVLSTGLFTSERSKETVFAGIEESEEYSRAQWVCGCIQGRSRRHGHHIQVVVYRF